MGSCGSGYVLGSCRGGPAGDRQDRFIKIILAAVYRVTRGRVKEVGKEREARAAEADRSSGSLGDGSRSSSRPAYGRKLRNEGKQKTRGDGGF